MKDSDVELRLGQPPVDMSLEQEQLSWLLLFYPWAVWGCLPAQHHLTCADWCTWVKKSVLCAGAFLSDTYLQVSERSREDACVTSGTQ